MHKSQQRKNVSKNQVFQHFLVSKFHTVALVQCLSIMQTSVNKGCLQQHVQLTR